MAASITAEKLKRNLAENCRRLRGERSLGEIAKLCSTPEWTAYPSTIQKVERMENNTRLFLVYRLAIALKVKVDTLLETPKKTHVDSLTKNGKFDDQFSDL